MKFDANRGMHIVHKADLLATIGEQMSFVQDSVAQPVTSLTSNETTSEMDDPKK